MSDENTSSALEQQQAEREQHYISQMMEWAIGILTFVGISFTVLLEVWINWDPTISFTARSRPHWLVLVIAINWEKSGSGGSRSDR